jgi:eukaryotic-like serine/threonine-protein kinase
VSPERHQKAGHLYHAALEVEPGSRAAFLDGACGGDEELRREAELLLRAHDKGGNYFAEPTLEIAAGLVAERQSLSLAGKSLSHYRVLSLIGAGGMGEVYLAEDMRLGRRLALKLLPASVTNDAERVRRFEQEARAASALNHPNILTIYEIGEVDGCHFIATEYVKGETLRQRMSGKNISLKEALDIIVQIADALSAAHKVGVVHRDIKPENIMIRQDGYIKVLDFGLAKLTERTTTDGRSERGLLPLVSTEPGLVMGTPQYMSPEQVRGIDVDERTDIFSLGIVFYEVLAGRPPFEGSTVSDLIAAILHKEPPPINEAASGVSAALQRIIRRILLKDKEERYQAVEEFLFDIERLQPDEKHLDHHQATLPRLSGRADTQAITETTKAESRAETPKGILVQNINLPGNRTLRIQNALHSIKRHKSAALLTLAALLLVSPAIVYLAYKSSGPSSFNNDSTNQSQGIKTTRIANTGEARSVVISPDGKYVAYTAGDRAKPSIWIKQVTTSNNIQIVPPTSGIYGNLIFPVSGDFIYYNEIGNGLYQVSILGGTSRKIVSTKQFVSSFSLSPDEKKVALLEGPKTLVVVNVDGTERREITKPADYEFFCRLHGHLMEKVLRTLQWITRKDTVL